MSTDPLAQIETQLRAKALNERKAALDSLAVQPAAVAVPILQRLAAENDFLLRRLAVMGLGNHPSNEAFTTLSTMLTAEQDNNVLAEVANSLFEFGDRAVPLLVNLFNTRRDWLIRQTVLALLMEAEQPETLLQVATAALNDDAQTVRETAILALRQVLSSDYQAAALALLGDLAKSDYWRDRWRAAIALTGCQAPAARQLIQTLQQDEHYRVSAAALDAAMG
ncbi:MAG: HEAT repeat domain-containing protein [Leptolyngbya sp. SIO4C1]|nr:HEAT repeat domain-containing protein [Leptolyngbya sp. SIO4C1]